MPKNKSFASLKPFFSLIVLAGLFSGRACGDEFQNVSAAFGTTLTLAGVNHATFVLNALVYINIIGK